MAKPSNLLPPPRLRLADLGFTPRQLPAPGCVLRVTHLLPLCALKSSCMKATVSGLGARQLESSSVKKPLALASTKSVYCLLLGILSGFQNTLSLMYSSC